jgi:hypothetical protein
MFSSELTYFLVLSILFLGAPFFPTQFLHLLDLLVVRVALVILLLFLIRLGPTAGIFGLMAIAALYVERNRRKVSQALKKLDAMDPETQPPALIETVLAPQTTVPVKSFDAPNEEEYSFAPEDDSCDITNFEPVAPTINQKGVLTTIYHGEGSVSSAAELFEEMGMGHIQGVETMQ